MSNLPTLELAWHFRPNRLVANAGTAIGTNRAFLLDLVDSFISTTGWVDKNNAPVTPSNMATVYYSCNGVTAGTPGDGVNRWTTAADLVWANAGIAHSWIVLDFAALGYQLLISCESGSVTGSIWTVVMTPGQFSGGTTLNRPTSANETIVSAAGTIGAAGSAAADLRLHAMKSTTGLNWRMFGCNAGFTNTALLFEQVHAFDAAWTSPIVAYAQGTSSASALTPALVNAYNFNGRHSGTNMTACATVPVANGTLLTTAITSANGISGTWPFLSHQLYSATATRNGVHGYVRDFWPVPSAIANGTTAPTTPDVGESQHMFVVLGSTIHPWCSTPVLIA